MTGASDSIPAAMADHLRRSYGVSSTIIRADMLR